MYNSCIRGLNDAMEVLLLEYGPAALLPLSPRIRIPRGPLAFKFFFSYNVVLAILSDMVTQ